MKYYSLHPEVPGHLASVSRVDRSVFPPIVKSASVVFDGWLGDDLVRMLHCMLVTERLALAIVSSGFTGCAVRDVAVGTSDLFQELSPDLELPIFRWLDVTGLWGRDDFGAPPSKPPH